MPLILGTNSIKDTGFNVDNSVRFNAADSPSLKIAIGSGATNTKKFTFSGWFKKCSNVGGTGAAQTIFDINGTNTGAYFNDDHDQFTMNLRNEGATNYIFKTNRKFRDNSAWLHIVVAIDTTQATEGNRVTVYFNGVEETSWAEENYPDQNYEPGFNGGTEADFYIGAVGTTKEFNGYIAEVVCIDGTKYAASDFGEFDEDSPRIWKPKDVSGLTFGNKGFYLDFKASGNLGNDANGGTDLTEANLAATDQSIDTCTNNFTTMNVLQVGTANWVFTEGNLHVAIPSGTNWKSIFSNFGVANGKWYYEVKVSGNFAVGIGLMGGSADDYTYLNGSDADGSGKTDVWRYRRNGASAYYSTGSSSTELGTVPADNDIIGIAYNADAGAIYSSINGSWQNSATITEIAAGTTTNALFDDITTGVTFAIFGSTENADNLQFNFGSPIHSISSGNADGNGYGNFEYTVPTNFYALCTKNLAEYG